MTAASNEPGSATLLAVAVVAVVAMLALVAVDIGVLLRTRLVAATAADAGALAAAPLTFAPGFGDPAAEAARLVTENGARLVACDCAVDRTWTERTVTVVASASALTYLAGTVTLTVGSRAEFDPVAQFAD